MQTARLMYCLLYFFTCTSLLQAEGFATGTIVKTLHGYTKIEQLNIGDKVVSVDHSLIIAECPITNITHHTINCCIKIGINNEYIYTTPNQKFYSYNQQKWIYAHQLQPSDLLTDWQGQEVSIDTVEIINKQCTIHQLSVDTHHTLCVSSHNLIVHNSPEVVIHFFSCAVPIITEIIQTGLAVSAAFIGAHWAQKISKKHRHNAQHETINNSYANSGFGGGGGWQDPEDDENKHPHGIYEDAPYHHLNSKGKKNPCPKDGQKCLDYSLPAQGKQRISIEDNTFVILKYTSPDKYHGYIVEWKELEDFVREILIKNGFVKRSGKIIKQMTQKVLT